MKQRIISRSAHSLQRYGVLLVPNFSLIALASIADPLRLANAVLGKRVYEWLTLGIDQAEVTSSDGIRVVPDASIRDGLSFDAVFVIGPNPIPRRGFTEVVVWLRRQAARGVALGGIDTGSYFLARAGLLDGYRCTIHWEDRDVLLERFPNLVVSSRLFEVDRDRYTSSGGVGPLEMMIWMLGQPPGGRDLAERVGDLLVFQRRGLDEHQTIPLRYRMGNVPQLLLDALELMENNLEELLTPIEIATYLGVSRRTLERMFQKQLNLSPSQKYLEIRLTRARIAVVRTDSPLEEVARHTGFASVSHFVQRYRHAHGRTPTADRAFSRLSQ